MSRHTFFASAPKHMGDLLADELRGLGLADATETRGGARFSGDLEAAYRACLWSRVANRILLPLAEFAAEDADALYAGVTELPWEDHFSPAQSIAVQFDGALNATPNRHYATLRVKDAIVDRFSARCGQRPDVDTEWPDIGIHVYAQRDQVTVSLDLSGGSLHRRGYRRQGSAAPLKENLAAALLLRAGWPELAAEGAALLDPMCGSGTLVIEGALIAADIAPGLLREHFGFLGWSAHQPEVWAALCEEARARAEAGRERVGTLRGYDCNPNAIRVAIDDLALAGLTGLAHFERRELSDCLPVHAEDRGLVIVNPPYGERLGADDDLEALYARLGSVLRERFLGWRAAVFTGSPELGHQLGLRAHRTHTLYNGPIECRLLHFQIEAERFATNRPRPLPPESLGPGAEMFANRLRKNLKALRKWCKREAIDCYRLYDADLPEYAFAIDVYGGVNGRWVNVQEYAPPASVDQKRARLRAREAMTMIPEVLEIPAGQVHFKVRRQQKGASQYERIAETRRFHEVAEGGHRFLVNFEDYLDTGLFLDHRDTRALVGRLAAGARFLNLFAYTASATVYAARGGARSTTTVDMSRTYLDWAERNLVLNDIGGHDHTLVQADCLQWIERHAGRREFDLIFLDPPSFSSSKRMQGTFDVQRDHVDLIAATMRLLAPTGTLIFSNNRRGFRMDHAALPRLEITDLTAQTLPHDFARNPRIHNCWQIRRRDPARGSDVE
ncbi:bifunctional 23S rRNA (guanine(2069)-N(7))-methyltransferase RlmK/23S rRNA (guanine(2445)-N(2))-methyltransferase RlmL [Marichromatium gracile]|uniref:Ribosomal RNA large subunit methyltransferase K/L n=1 Tax=Marichromatium gracile TaxID=1048 RepID=A0A4R4A6H6_MARGR|nr:bifunctional 23S rRNA (guanine(2069)-N(7))-methyltransferase RlmK/23S rRNA (guanine(2445)-N(2))-methyltransferase RlmL [Marichromatium gracile]MBK1708390.1 23S rRNA (guanine(2445)-N(2))/(guanine(2069)-N(7))-methyltransferase [Marichromatium gracile]TCW34234.1 23S rRNA m(2)G-2445 methyltransferase [Marichromatium gracile]